MKAISTTSNKTTKHAGMARLQANREQRRAADASGSRGRSGRNTAKSDDQGNFLSVYFREMSGLDVLKPEQEFQAARELEKLESLQWAALLSYPPLIDEMCNRIHKQLGLRASTSRAVRKAAAELRKSSSNARREKMRNEAFACGVRLRGADRDRESLSMFVAEIRHIAAIGTWIDGSKVRMTGGARRSITAYAARVQKAEAATMRSRNAFVKANLRLVVSIARRFNYGRMSLADLIQEGNIGLMKAVERYDYRRGFRFSTYASWWIRHAISRALADKGREVRLPVHMIDAYHRVSQAKRRLSSKLGRTATTAEVSAETGIPKAKLEKMRTYLADRSYSLDRPVNDDDGRRFVDLLTDDSDEDGDLVDRLAFDQTAKEVRQILGDLKPMEADILRRRFGLDDDKELTLKEIGSRYGLSRERIRQLQEQALGKVRRALSLKNLL